MSSDDSSTNNKDNFEDMYCVKILPWRQPNISQHMSIINANQYLLKDVDVRGEHKVLQANPAAQDTKLATARKGFAAQGSKPIPRDRNKSADDAIVSTRQPPQKGWPQFLYDPEWLQEHPEEGIMFAVSRDTFSWIDWAVTVPPRWQQSHCFRRDTDAAMDSK